MSTYQRSDRHRDSIAKARSIAAGTKSQCRHCKGYYTKANITKHETGCYDNPLNLKSCKSCASRIKHTQTFCTKSCAATYNNVLFPKRERTVAFNESSNSTKETPLFVCKGCNKEHPLRKNALGLYCTGKCQQAYLWETVTKPSILRGERTQTKVIRRFLIERDGPGCSDCGTVEWKGRPMTMDVDHIDGDHTNNKPDNFRLICPNCHRQTPTWGKKNPKRYGTSSLRHTPR